MIPDLYYISSIAVTLAGALWYLQGQFNSTKNFVLVKTDQLQKAILDKLEYHERHDDQRFSSVRDDLWEIRVRNAAIDGPLANKSRDITSN